MAILKAKFCGLNEDDIHSVKSMLSVANDHLTNEWQIVTSGEADLYIYSFDSDDGLSSWEQHNPEKISALLTTEDSSEEHVDLLLKKPLRTKNFSTILDEAEHKILSAQAKQSQKPSSGFISYIFSGLLNKKSDTKQPHLYLPVPDDEDTGFAAELDPRKLAQLLEKATDKQLSQQVKELSNHLQAINRTTMAVKKRIALLELYTTPIKNLAEQQQLSKNKQTSHDDYLDNFYSTSELIDELIIGYQRIINDELSNNSALKPKTPFLLAVNRVAEFIALSIYYANSYYFSAPKGAINKLHQLYLYCEHYKVLDAEVESSSKEYSTFELLYSSVMLTLIANPSRLKDDEISRTQALLQQFANKVEISVESDDKKEQSLAPESVGCFLALMSTDNPPKALFESNKAVDTASQIRTFNTHAILHEIEALFQQGNDSDNVELLKKIIPQFNASYTRSHLRKQCPDSPKVKLIKGVAEIHQYLNTQSFTNAFNATLRNQSTGGAMISSDELDSYQLEIGDLVGIINPDDSHHLAFVRWMTSIKDSSSQIGLEFLPDPTPVQMGVGNNEDTFVGLLLPIPSGSKSVNSIIVDNNTYLPLQTIRVTEKASKYKIAIDTSIDTSYNCKQFSYSLKS